MYIYIAASMSSKLCVISRAILQRWVIIIISFVINTQTVINKYVIDMQLLHSSPTICLSYMYTVYVFFYVNLSIMAAIDFNKHILCI